MENITNVLTVFNNFIKEVVATLSVIVSFLITLETFYSMRDKRISDSKKKTPKKKKGDSNNKSKRK